MTLPEYANLTPAMAALLVDELVELIKKTIPDGDDKSDGIRKLLEAKDCFVRSVLP